MDLIIYSSCNVGINSIFHQFSSNWTWRCLSQFKFESSILLFEQMYTFPQMLLYSNMSLYYQVLFPLEWEQML